MKGKRFAAVLLVLALLGSLLVLPASAVTFSDITSHWGRADIEALATEGVVKGVGENKFAPDRLMTACEALLFCSRAAGVSETAKAAIAEQWAEKLKTLLPESVYSWACTEMAVCLETGILTETELAALTESGAILKSISRADLAVYLVRAMQMEPLAKSLSTYPLNFADSGEIATAVQPYVYLLSMYGIVKGNEKQEFMPAGALSRAEMTTMLRRAIDFMAERGIYAELPAYTDYDWTGGTITAITQGENGAVALALDNLLTGEHGITLPADTAVYENNMLTTLSSLKVGEYVRVNLDSKGAAQSVRLGGTPTTCTGTVTALTQQSVTIDAEGQSRRWSIDRFTQVQAGETVGGAEVIDPEAGYASALCLVDEMGHLAAVYLSGGSRQEKGLLTGISAAAEGSLLQVAAFDGAAAGYNLPADAVVRVNGLAGTLQSSHIGSCVSMRVSNEDDRVLELNVDTVTKYVQGALRSCTTNGGASTLVLEDLSSGSTASYKLLADAVIRYSGGETTLDKLEKGCFATLCLTGGEVARVEAYPGTAVSSGTVERIVYGSPIRLSVRLTGGTVVYELPLDSLPTVIRDGKSSSIEKLRVGDTVEITARYHQVSRIDAVGQSSTVSGVISRVVQDSAGVTLDLTLAGGSGVSYTVSESVSVTQMGKAQSVYSLRVNDQVKLTMSSGQVVSIEVTEVEAGSVSLSGTVMTKNTGEKTLVLLLGSGNVVTVDVSAASFVDAAGGVSSLSKLNGDDSVTVYGNYAGAVFKATLVVRT